jgi:hypothetical protein
VTNTEGRRLNEGLVGNELEVDLLILDKLLVFQVDLGDSLLNLSSKLVCELILERGHFQLDACQVHYILKLLEEGLLGLFKHLWLLKFPATVNKPLALNDLF